MIFYALYNINVSFNMEGHQHVFFQESIHKQVFGKVIEGFSTTFH